MPVYELTWTIHNTTFMEAASVEDVRRWWQDADNAILAENTHSVEYHNLEVYPAGQPEPIWFDDEAAQNTCIAGTYEVHD